MRIAVTSGHIRSVLLAYDNGKPLTENGATLVALWGPALKIHGLTRSQINARGTALGGLLKKLLGKLSADRKALGFAETDRLALALPGVSSTRDLEVAQACVTGSCWPATNSPNFCVVDDTYAGLIAGSLSTMGICALAGTGASVYMGTANGETRPYNCLVKLPFKRDGYGPLLGDHGSGFRLGMTALERICRHLDSIDAAPPAGTFDSDVWKLIEALDRRRSTRREAGRNKLLYEDESPLQAWFEDLMANRSPKWQSRIAGLAEVITPAAEAGNKFAQELVDGSAREMFDTIEDALRLDDFADLHGAPIFGQGGMFRHSPRYLQRIRELLVAKDLSNPIELARYMPGVGTLLIAISANWTIPNNADRDAVLRAIDSVPPESRPLVFNAP